MRQPLPGYLMPHQVAAIFRVSPRTVTRWCKNGLMNAVRTPGGQFRVAEEEVARVIAEGLREGTTEQEEGP